MSGSTHTLFVSERLLRLHVVDKGGRICFDLPGVLECVRQGISTNMLDDLKICHWVQLTEILINETVIQVVRRHLFL